MLVHKGGKIKNWRGECRDVTPTKLQSQNIFKERTGDGLGVRTDVNEEVFVKIQKKKLGGGGSDRGGGVGGRVGGDRVDVNRKVKFL